MLVIYFYDRNHLPGDSVVDLIERESEHKNTPSAEDAPTPVGMQSAQHGSVKIDLINHHSPLRVGFGITHSLCRRHAIRYLSHSREK